MKRLVVFPVFIGVLLSAAITAGGCRRPVPVTPLRVVAEIDWEKNLLLREGVEMIASSYNQESQRVEMLLDNTPATFWHIEEAMSDLPAWVEADFGENSPEAISGVAARPRSGYGEQFFRNAQVQASDDGINWKTLAWVRQAVVPEEPEWYRADFDNREAFRFWRLLVLDGHIGPRGHFLSIGDLAFFE